MISYTFGILSYYFETSLIFLEIYCAFLFKVYIKQSQIWGTLPASEMELFGTIAIGNQRRI